MSYHSCLLWAGGVLAHPVFRSMLVVCPCLRPSSEALCPVLFPSSIGGITWSYLIPHDYSLAQHLEPEVLVSFYDGNRMCGSDQKQRGDRVDFHSLRFCLIEHFRNVCVLSRFSHVRLFANPWTIPLWRLCPWDFPGKSAGVDCHALLQGILLTQGSNPRFL